MEFKVVSKEIAKAHDFFGRGSKYFIVTGCDECGRRISLDIPHVSHLLPTDLVVFGEGDDVAGRV